MSAEQAGLAAFDQKTEAAIEATSHMRQRLLDLIASARDVDPEYATAGMQRVGDHIIALGNLILQKAQRRH